MGNSKERSSTDKDKRIEILSSGNKYIYVVVRKLTKKDHVTYGEDSGRLAKVRDKDWGFVCLENTESKARRSMERCVEAWQMTGDYGEVFGVASFIGGKCILLDTMTVKKPTKRGKKNG